MSGNSNNYSATKTEVKSNEVQSSIIANEWMNGWELMYWPGFGGRAQYVRLMLELSKAEYEQPLKDLEWDEAHAQIQEMCGTGDARKALAVPILVHKQQNVFISQTSGIILFLTDIFPHLKPNNLLDMSRARLMMLQVFDAIEEAIVATHPTDRSADYSTQKEAADVFLAEFLNNRLYKHLEVLAAELKRNNNGKGWFYGQSITFVDVCSATFVRAYEFSVPEHYSNASNFQILKDHRQRFENQEFYQNFVKSDRCPPINRSPSFCS